MLQTHLRNRQEYIRAILCDDSFDGIIVATQHANVRLPRRIHDLTTAHGLVHDVADIGYPYLSVASNASTCMRYVNNLRRSSSNA